MKEGPLVKSEKTIGFRISLLSDKPYFPGSFDVIDQDVMVLPGTLAVGLSSDDQEKNKKAQLVVGLVAIATQIGFALPHSRDMEHEADHIGTIYTAKAGYDPRLPSEFGKK